MRVDKTGNFSGPSVKTAKKAHGPKPPVRASYRFGWGQLRVLMGVRSIAPRAECSSDPPGGRASVVLAQIEPRLAKAHDGDYADAQSKGYGFTLLVSESSGAVNGALEATLRRNAKLARAPGTKDFTQYGEARASPKDYYRHHLAAHCSAVVYADATVLLNEAANLGYGLVQGEFG